MGFIQEPYREGTRIVCPMNEEFTNLLSMCDSIVARTLLENYSWDTVLHEWMSPTQLETVKNNTIISGVLYLRPSSKNPYSISYWPYDRFLRWYKEAGFVGTPNKPIDEWEVEDIDLGSFSHKIAFDVVSTKMVAKPAKLLRKIFGEYFTEHEYEIFSNQYKAAVVSRYNPEDIDFVEVKGEDIAHYYLWENYAKPDAGGTLSNSCMRYDHCQDYLGIYVENPENVSMVVALDGDKKLLGRAILWEDADGNKLMDRVYADTDFLLDAFDNYGREKDYWIKDDRRSCFVKGDKTRPPHSDIKLKCTEFDYYPYMDSFIYLSRGYGVSLDDGDYTLQSTEGLINEDVCCEDCGYEYSEDDMYYIDGDNYCADCSRYSDRYGDRIQGFRATYSDLQGDYFYEEDVIWCAHDNSYIYMDDVVEVLMPNGNYDHFWENSTKIIHSTYYNDLIYLEADTIEVKDDYIYRDDLEEYEAENT